MYHSWGFELEGKDVGVEVIQGLLVHNRRKGMRRGNIDLDHM